MSHRNKTVCMYFAVNVQELVDGICGDHELAEEVIKAIDQELQDWDFTLAMADYFDNLREEYKKECTGDE